MRWVKAGSNAVKKPVGEVCSSLGFCYGESQLLLSGSIRMVALTPSWRWLVWNLLNGKGRRDGRDGRDGGDGLS